MEAYVGRTRITYISHDTEIIIESKAQAHQSSSIQAKANGCRCNDTSGCDADIAVALSRSHRAASGTMQPSHTM